VAVDNALNNSEADPGARKLSLRVQPVKRPEHLIRIARIEACPVVFYIIDHLSALFNRPNCLIENRNESVSLPQIRNRYEKVENSLLEVEVTGGGNEANDEGKEKGGGDPGATVSKSQEKG